MFEELPLWLLISGLLLWCMAPAVTMAVFIGKRGFRVIGEDYQFHDGGPVLPRLLALTGILAGGWLVLTSALLRFALFWLVVKHHGSNAAGLLIWSFAIGVMVTLISTYHYRRINWRWKNREG